MAKENQDFTMWQGETVNITAALVDESDVPLPITGSTVVWRIWRNGVQLLEKTTGGGITIVNSAVTDDGVLIALSPSDTDTLPASIIYDHECRVTDPSANQNVFFTGKIDLRESITK